MLSVFKAHMNSRLIYLFVFYRNEFKTPKRNSLDEHTLFEILFNIKKSWCSHIFTNLNSVKQEETVIFLFSPEH